MNAELEVRGTFKAVCSFLRELAREYPGWTVEQYIRLKRLETVEKKQFEEMFKSK